MAEPSDSFSWRSVAVGGFGPNLLYGVAEGAFMAVAVLVARDLGASVPVAALVVVVFGVGSLLTNVPAGRLVRVVGEGRALVLAGVVGVVGALVCGTAPTVLVYLLGTFVLGASGAVVKLARQSYLAAVVPLRRRGLAMSTLGGVFRIGVFVGPLAGAAVIGAYGLRSTFVLVGVAIALTGLLGLAVREVPTTGEKARPVRTTEVVREHARVLATVGLGMTAVTMLRAVRAVAIPLWAESVGVSPATIALIFAVSALADVLLFVPAGICVDRFGRKIVVVPAMVLMGGCLAVLPLAGSAGAIVAVGVALGVGNGLTSGIVMTLGADHAPPGSRAEFIGVWRLLADVGTLGGPAVISGVTALAGLSWSLVLVGGLGLAGAVLLQRSIVGPPPA